jgi:ABC-type multidrug transport system fused ATPase/permease subunit
MSLQVVRYVAAIAIAVVLAVLLLVVVVAALHPERIGSQQLVSLLAAVGTLVGILAGLFGVTFTAGGVQENQAAMRDVQEKVNGHLSKHLGHSDQEIEQMIEARLNARGVFARPAAPEAKE